jgi:putative inorganic carbon (HCO3(-)) transporter
MPVFAALTGPLPKAGVIVVAALTAGVLLARDPRTRAFAFGGALALAPVLLLADIWSSPQLRLVHRNPLPAAVVVILAVGVLIALAAAIARRPWLLGVLAVAALPFRVPIQASGTTSNLLVPLYLVVAAGALSFIAEAWRGRAEENRAGWVERILALYVVVYALQAVYSTDFEKALQQIVFFYVPFALLFAQLRRLDWTPRLVRICFTLVVVLAIAFACIGFVEYATKTILLNPKLVVANDLHTYFTVNSVFFDPDIFGRFLALVMIGLAAALVFDAATREPGPAGDDAEAEVRPAGRSASLRRLGPVIAALAVLWCGLVLTLSRSSLGALLVGLGTLGALRWHLRRALVVAGAVIVVGGMAIAVSPKTFGLNQGLNGASSGRANLVTGGTNLFADRPLWGYGSGSFVHEYRVHNPTSSQTLSASHTIPITIAAEQGVIGEVVYLALVIMGALTLLRGSREDPVRAAVAAAFLALVFHSLLYADFLEDPVTWALLAVGCALAASPTAAAGQPRELAGSLARST